MLIVNVLKNKDHIRDDLMCGFEFFTFEKEVTFYHLKDLKRIVSYTEVSSSE